MQLSKLYNNEKICQDACADTKVHYFDGSEYFCDENCYALGNFVQTSMFNSNNTCTSTASTVTFEKDQDVFTDSSCDKIADFLNLTYLYNNNGKCESACLSTEVQYIHNNEVYCDISCKKIAHNLSIAKLFYNGKMCQDACDKP